MKGKLKIVIGILLGIAISVIGFISITIFSLRNENKNDIFNQHQIVILERKEYKNDIYTLALETSGFQDKVIFIQLYKIELSQVINTTNEYKSPFFQEIFWAREGKEQNNYSSNLSFDIIRNEVIIYNEERTKELYRFVVK